MDAARQRLADAMEARRLELDLLWREVAERAGMSEANLARIRNGSVKSPRAKSLAAIERALEWRKGSIEAILNGGEPTPLSATESMLNAAQNPDSTADPQRDSSLAVMVKTVIDSSDPIAAVIVRGKHFRLVMVADASDVTPENIEEWTEEALEEWRAVTEGALDRLDTSGDSQDTVNP